METLNFEALEKPEKKKSRMENDNSSRFGLEEKIQLPIPQQKNMELEYRRSLLLSMKRKMKIKSGKDEDGLV